MLSSHHDQRGGMSTRVGVAGWSKRFAPHLSLSGQSHPRRRRIFELTVLGLLLLTSGLAAYGPMDVLLWDETIYLSRGIEPEAYATAGWEDSLAYSFMYTVISLFVSDPISTYLIGRTLASVLIVLGLFTAIRLNTGPIPALTGAGVVAVLPLTYVWPSVASPSAALLAVGLGIVWRWCRAWSLGLATVFVWIAAAARPEFTWAAIACSLWTIAWQVRDWYRGSPVPRPWQGVVSVLGGVAVPLTVIAAFGNILASSPRQWTAFTQHFALRNVAPDIDPWVNADDAAREAFPTSYSIMQAVVENPQAFTEHLLGNAGWLPVTLIGHAAGLGDQTLFRPVSTLVPALFFIGVILAMLVNRHHLRKLLLHALHARMSAIVLAGLLLVAFAIPATVIYPRPHYLILPVSILIFASALALAAMPNKAWQALVPVATTAVGVIVLGVVATAGVIDRAANPPPWEASLRALDAQTEQVRVVSVDERICVYVEGCVALPTPSRNERGVTFARYLEMNGVNAVLNVPILADSAWGEMSGTTTFMQDPASFGFTKLIDDGPIVSISRMR